MKEVATTFRVVAILAAITLSVGVVWLVADDERLIGTDYRLAVLPVLSICVVGISVRTFCRSSWMTTVSVLVLDALMLSSFVLAVRRWPGGDDGRGVAFVLLCGGMSGIIVLSDVVSGIASALPHGFKHRDRKGV